jgi:molecular chaperone DnaK
MKDPLAVQRLDEAAEKAKIELSTAVQTEINIPFITSGSDGPKHLVLTITRTKLEELSQEFLDRAMAITKRAMEASPFKVGDLNEVVLVGGQTRMPAMQAAVKEFFKRDPHMGVNPDEVVAIGAALQGGIIGGDVKDILLLDVIPLSLGIETLGGVNTKLIEKNTTIPASKSQVFSTAADNQTEVTVHVVQGERAMASDNKSLGQFNLGGIAPAHRGTPQIEVTFDIDANGILQVKAKDKTTGKENSIKIEARSSLTKEEIDKMAKDAEAHAAEDAKKKENAEMKNNAEQLIYTSEKAVKENKDKISADIVKGVEDKVAALKAVKDGTDAAAIKKASEELGTELSKIGDAMSKAQAAEAVAKPQGAAGEPKKEEGPVRDADFKEGDKK